jgi:hypothetical protein
MAEKPVVNKPTTPDVKPKTPVEPYKPIVNINIPIVKPNEIITTNPVVNNSTEIMSAVGVVLIVGIYLALKNNPNRVVITSGAAMLLIIIAIIIIRKHCCWWPHTVKRIDCCLS